MEMDTNITFNVRDERMVEIRRDGVTVGGVRLVDDNHRVELYGFTELMGPWSCGRHRERSDCVIHFGGESQQEALGRYAVIDGDCSMKLSMTCFQIGGYSVRANFRLEGGISFSANESTKIDVLIDSRMHGDIWSKLLDRGGYVLPYPHCSGRRTADSVQMCGFSGITQKTKYVATDRDPTYRAELRVYRNTDCSTRVHLEFRAPTVAELRQKLDCASHHLQNTLHAVNERLVVGKVTDLLKKFS